MESNKSSTRNTEHGTFQASNFKLQTLQTFQTSNNQLTNNKKGAQRMGTFIFRNF
jgi:hypothetical protein